MILKQLNLNFLSKHLGVESFKLFKSTYHSICDDGHFESSVSDKEIASLCINIIRDVDADELMINTRYFNKK